MGTFPSYVQVSLRVARDLAGQAGYVTRVLERPLTLDPDTQLVSLIGTRVCILAAEHVVDGRAAVRGGDYPIHRDRLVAGQLDTDCRVVFDLGLGRRGRGASPWITACCRPAMRLSA